MKIEIIAILISVLSFLIACFGVWVAFLAYKRDTSKLIIKPFLTQSPHPNKDGIHEIAFTVKIINCGRRKDKIKVLILRAPGFSPTLSYYYYIDIQGVANKIINEAEDFSVSVPLTPFIHEAIQRCKEIYLVNSADEVLRASRKSIRKLKKTIQLISPMEIEDKEKWKVFLVKSPSRLFSVPFGVEYKNSHFNVDENYHFNVDEADNV